MRDSLVCIDFFFSERRVDKARYYNLSRVKKGRKWLKVIFKGFV